MPGRRHWQALGVGMRAFESCMCLCVALPPQGTCFLALGFMLVFFFQKGSCENKQDVICHMDNIISGKE